MDSLLGNDSENCRYFLDFYAFSLPVTILHAHLRSDVSLNPQAWTPPHWITCGISINMARDVAVSRWICKLLSKSSPNSAPQKAIFYILKAIPGGNSLKHNLFSLGMTLILTWHIPTLFPVPTMVLGYASCLQQKDLAPWLRINLSVRWNKFCKIKGSLGIKRRQWKFWPKYTDETSHLVLDRGLEKCKLL